MALKKKKPKGAATKQASDADLLAVFDETQQEQHTFENPAQIPDELKELYEEHKKLLGNYQEWKPPVIAEEDEAVFQRAMRLRPKSRTNPNTNPDLMPQKEIVDEKW